MRSLVACLLLLLAGCASASQVYQKPVARTAVSTKSVDTVSRCLQLELATAPVTLPDGRTGFMMDNGHGVVLGIVTIEPLDAGTKLELKKQGALAFGFHRWDPCL